ncbi:hypothetical protein METBIDRAFT_40315 [Metschnikowia bicuspidata var. bicuspidata NRRL YB-4993]|uniref:Pep3/Vps18 beta-propeller domain-containing protein n=1 Tax=Metschnikowia bicuspidata var. bicuspidata NRRL YB-4993 TaxID=869754 RepID=A0A1A0HE78_9ASCO|nr:hypothetical protein METBIDRAFT_40315 [Metschnikowia bicuspidata var. bicuspidata NRRL YB-4993]OBA22208.1 hypothetical protein METBIDRAFT_40315 [Metschnikowia bicuspidata var. bicuspidata NRRL YB-4993]
MNSTQLDVPFSSVLRDVAPQINLELVQLQFDISNEVRDLLVEKNMMFILTTSAVFRIDLSDPLSVTRVMLPGEVADNLILTNSWLHLNGEILIIQMNSCYHYLLHSSYNKFKPLPRFKGLKIEHVVFGNSTNSIGDLIIATKEGIVYVASVKCHDPETQGNKRDDKFIRQIHNMKEKISGIIFHKDCSVQIFTSSGRTSVWACQLTTLQDIMQALRQTPLESKVLFKQNMEYHFYASSSTYYCISPESGKVHSNDLQFYLSSSKVIDWGDYNIRLGKLSMVTTDHYLLYLSADSRNLIGLSKLLESAPLVVPLTPTVGNESVLGLTAESNGQTRWLFTNSNIYEITVSNEYLSLWFSFYKLGDYDTALKMVESEKSNEACAIRNLIYAKQAYELLREGGFGVEVSEESSTELKQRFDSLKRGIELLAKLQEPFEKVALMLLSIDEERAFSGSTSRGLLREYLLLKMHQSRHGEERMNKTILSAWVVKCFLQAMQTINLQSMSGINSDTKLETRTKSKNTIGNLGISLLSFLKGNLQFVDKPTIYELMKKAHLDEILLSFADLLQDYEFIARHHIECESWSEAIQTIRKIHGQKNQNSNEIILEASFPMLSKCPQATIDFWLSLDDFDFEIILPAIIHFNQLHRTLPYGKNPTLTFLLKIICEKGKSSMLLNNQYLLLLISQSVFHEESEVTKDVMRTLEFLRSNVNGIERGRPFDSNLILRSCLRFKRIEPAVSILVNDLKQYETALKLALSKGSSYLGELVLRQFDENWHNHDAAELSKNERELEDLSTRNDSSTRLENDTLRVRKTLWFEYARYLIERASRGSDPDTPPVNEYETSVIQSSISARVKEKVPVGETSRLGGVMTHLFSLSKAYGGTNDLISFKDFLPLLPESVLVSHFRNDIVQSLHYYNRHINHLALEMQDSSVTASKLRSQVAKTHSDAAKGIVYTIIEPGESCCLCGNILVEKNILLFQNCHHGCHKDCAARFFLQLNGNYRFKKLFQNFKHSFDLELKKSLDDFLTSACPLCNDSNINTLEDESFTLEKNKEELADWSIAHVTFSRS